MSRAPLFQPRYPDPVFPSILSPAQRRLARSSALIFPSLNRLILRVAQEGTSTFCLGEKGAENLLPHGQMLARLGGAPSVLCQVPFADLTELEAMVEVLNAPAVPAPNPVVA